ncbi:hypothetical protein TRVA0_013S01134 [Trichomonascus vanleenenianus]|uniref:NAD(P)/FAD-dependent oxidoreductase n=1 Tax=Trichomonascus vanleenenianus TaxID=2268995 RepID=UPI003ECAE7FF
MTQLDKKATIIIVGSGTFGCSTALYLARQGYSNVTCLDKYGLPSPISAGNDINKVVDYTDDPENETPDMRIAREAVELWKSDPVFRDYYHDVGVILAAVSDEPLKSTEAFNREQKLKGRRTYEYLSSPEDFKKLIPGLTGPLKGWRGYYLDREGGWAHARKAMESAAAEAARLGVNFVSGANGEVKELAIDNSTGKCIGVVTASGNTITADRIIVSAGANAALIADFKGQLQAKCFTLAHIKLTEEENKLIKDTPVLFNYERGFFFEADEEKSEMKICNEFPGYTNLDENGESVPVARHEIPLEAEQGIRDLLRETIPELADKPFVKARICWCTDSPDRNLILTTHPEHDNVVLASGDSGKSYMLIPIIGKYISAIAIGGNEALSEGDRECFRWRPETSKLRDDTQHRWGGKGVVTDLKDIDEWTNIGWDQDELLDKTKY